ncbi:outer membrane beta-barrel protein [Winogradskyella aquimaris]|uniref:Outer membrane beta-barrel protein n=1 Tax=Winogradskyella aquimaris TaxID=864074 RepID=A0ABU5ELD8_9FLAO|nr:outer membrane beta-barrel protein [Winogradskyella aquimaris]MDY2586826.1 outer membrane beta-barrel protein [Winogradskyella aquimaris]
MKKQIALIVFLLAFVGWIFPQQADDPEELYSISKGRYYTSLTFSLNSRNAENEDQLFRQVLDQDRYIYRIVGNAGYAIKDNFTLGLSLGYGESKEDIRYTDENDAELNSKRLQRGLSISPNMRNYIPIGKGKLQILVQTELGFTFGESLQRIYAVDNVDKIESDFFEFELGVSPGVALFFNKNWAFETRVNVAGFSTRAEELVTNNDEANRQRISETKIDLKLNLLELNLGVAYYF